MPQDMTEALPAGATHVDMGEESWVNDLADSVNITGESNRGADGADDGIDSFVSDTLKGAGKKESATDDGDETPQRGADGKFLPRDGKQSEKKVETAPKATPRPIQRAPYFHPELLDAARAEGLNPDRYENADKLELDIRRSWSKKSRTAPADKDDLPDPKFELPTDAEIDPKAVAVFKAQSEHMAALTKALKAERAERNQIKSSVEELKAQQRDSEARMTQTQRASTTRQLDELYERSDDSVKEYLARPSESLDGAEGETADRMNELGEYMRDRFDGMTARGDTPDLAKLWDEGVRALWPDLQIKKTKKEIQSKLDKGRGGTAARNAPRQSASGRTPSYITDRRGATKAWQADLRAQGLMD